MRGDIYDHNTIHAVCEMLLTMEFYYDPRTQSWFAVDMESPNPDEIFHIWCLTLEETEETDRLVYMPLPEEEVYAMLLGEPVVAMTGLDVYFQARRLFLAALRGHDLPDEEMPPPGEMSGY